MQVGIDSFAAAFDDSSRAVSPQERLRNLVEQIEHADQVGLDAFGVGEHHRREFLDSAPAVILGAAAARTQRIRLTSAVTVLSAADPVRVFQNFATIDLLSQGLTCNLETTEVRHVFVMTGAVPNTGWLDACALDEQGFIKTRPDLSPSDLKVAGWRLQRRPYLLETSRPGVFAVGDVRSGNVKRVGSAVGEGSIAVAFAHQLLHE
jgi:thioredoxin reductase